MVERDMKIHPHMLRHACGFKLANDGVDTRTIQAYLLALCVRTGALKGLLWELGNNEFQIPSEQGIIREFEIGHRPCRVPERNMNKWQQMAEFGILAPLIRLLRSHKSLVAPAQ